MKQDRIKARCEPVRSKPALISCLNIEVLPSIVAFILKVCGAFSTANCSAAQQCLNWTADVTAGHVLQPPTEQSELQADRMQGSFRQGFRYNMNNRSSRVPCKIDLIGRCVVKFLFQQCTEFAARALRLLVITSRASENPQQVQSSMVTPVSFSSSSSSSSSCHALLSCCACAN